MPFGFTVAHQTRACEQGTRIVRKRMKVDVVNRGDDLPDEDLRRDAISIFHALILLTDFYTGTKISTTSMVTSSALDELANSRLNSPSGSITTCPSKHGSRASSSKRSI